VSVTLLLGGARSGKSRRAEEIGHAFVGPVVYIATGHTDPGDPEWMERIEQHRKRRPSAWRTCEAPLELAETLAREAADPAALVIVDCLSVWLSNCLLASRPLATEVCTLESVVSGCIADCVLVSNEVGAGIVPATSLGRRFRDEQGILNQRVAALASRVELWVAGLPLVLKQEAARG